MGEGLLTSKKSLEAFARGEVLWGKVVGLEGVGRGRGEEEDEEVKRSRVVSS